MGWLKSLLKRWQERKDNKGKNKKEEVIAKIKDDLDDIIIDEKEDGAKIFEFYDAHRNFKKFSNTIRVEVSKEPRIINDREFYDCKVTWWKQNDSENEEERQIKREQSNYENVIVGIDLEKMMSEENNFSYLRYVMKNLLEENLVKSYIETAMIPDEEFDRPQYSHIVPCGRYVGEVVTVNNSIMKRFSKDIGKICHSAPDMRDERNKVIQYNKAKRQAMREREEAERDKLYAQIEEYERLEIG